MAEMIPTVLGEVASDQLGRVLAHEHIVSLCGSWGGSCGRGTPKSDTPQPGWRRAAIEHYTPLLTDLKASHGVGTIVESTPGWEARGPQDLELWAELSRRSGVNVVVTTGDFMGSELSMFGRPRENETAAQIADQMIKEAAEGVCGTGVRAGIIKINAVRGTRYGGRLIKAAAIAQRQTHLALTTCTGHHRFCLDVWEADGVPPQRVFLSHGDAVHPIPEIMELMNRGCSFNLTLWGIRKAKLVGWKWPILPEYHSPSFAAALVAEGYVRQIMPSIDYSAMSGFDDDGRVREDLYEQPGRNYHYMFTHAIPNMKLFGVTDGQIEVMLRDNPRRLLEKG